VIPPDWAGARLVGFDAGDEEGGDVAEFSMSRRRLADIVTRHGSCAVNRGGAVRKAW
jgi:hypothetical protein